MKEISQWIDNGMNREGAHTNMFIYSAVLHTHMQTHINNKVCASKGESQGCT